MSILEDIVKHVHILETDIHKCESMIKIQKNTLSTLQILLKQLSNQQQYNHITLEHQYNSSQIEYSNSSISKDHDRSNIDIISIKTLRKKKKYKSTNASINQPMQHIGIKNPHNSGSKRTRTGSKKRKAMEKTFEFCKLLPKFSTNPIKSNKPHDAIPTITITPGTSIQHIDMKDLKKPNISTSNNSVNKTTILSSSVTKIVSGQNNNGIQKENMKNEIENEDYLLNQNNKRKKLSNDILSDHSHNNSSSSNNNNNNINNNMNNSNNKASDKIKGAKNMFSGGKFKNSSILEYYLSLTTWYQKLEITIDLHYCITYCPKRLQIFLDQETGTRDLLLTWINQCNEYTSSTLSLNKITHYKQINTNNNNKTNNVDIINNEEVIVTRIIEYCLQVLNQAHWTAEDVNNYKFDRILKNLYKKHSHQNDNHKQKVALLVKDMWSIYRVMRKNYENSLEKVLA